MAGLFRVVLHAQDLQHKIDEIVNVFGYKSSIPVVSEEDALANSFVSQILPTVAGIVHARNSFYRVEVFNVTNGVGYRDWSVSPPVVGTRSGDSEPNFNAWGFRYNRVAAGTRNGYKRFGVIAESDVSDGVAASAFLATLTSAATTLGTPIHLGIIDTWFPVVLQRKPPHVFPWTSTDIGSVTYQVVTSQNSRKN